MEESACSAIDIGGINQQLKSRKQRRTKGILDDMEEDMEVAMFFMEASNEEKKVSHENNEIISKD
jgi:hypothetical protein